MRHFLIAGAVVLSSTQLFAATYTVTPTFARAYSADGRYDLIEDYEVCCGGPAVLQVDFVVSFSNPAPGQFAFAAVVFDINYDGAVSNVSVPGYQANNPSGGSVSGPLFVLFANNSDFGNGTDLIDIVVGVTAGLNPASGTDPRVKIELGAGTTVGSAFFDYAGGGVFTISTNVKSAGYIASGGVLTVDQNATLVGGQLANGLIPEPTTCVLAGLALVGAAARGRV